MKIILRKMEKMALTTKSWAQHPCSLHNSVSFLGSALACEPSIRFVGRFRYGVRSVSDRATELITMPSSLETSWWIPIAVSSSWKQIRRFNPIYPTLMGHCNQGCLSRTSNLLKVYSSSSSITKILRRSG